MPPGDGQVITYSAFSDSTRAFDAHGNLIPVPAYKKFELGTYLEYGVTDWLTLSASPAYDRVPTPPPGQSYTGLGESEVAARVGLYHSDTAVLSVQAGLRSPGASFDSLCRWKCAAPLPSTCAAWPGAIASSRGTRPRPDTAFMRKISRANGGSPRFLVMLQSFTSISNGTSQFGHVSWTKLQPSFVYDIAQQWSVQVGGFITVAGINAGRELGPTAGVWYRF
jgi:protein XagA